MLSLENSVWRKKVKNQKVDFSIDRLGLEYPEK